jgi:GTP cyclohydrolase III
MVRAAGGKPVDALPNTFNCGKAKAQDVKRKQNTSNESDKSETETQNVKQKQQK